MGATPMNIAALSWTRNFGVNPAPRVIGAAASQMRQAKPGLSMEVALAELTDGLVEMHLLGTAILVCVWREAGPTGLQRRALKFAAADVIESKLGVEVKHLVQV